jgi:deoxycytidylate deaminase
MRYLSGDEEKRATRAMNEAAKEALKSKCLRARAGSVIIKDGEIIGRGFNSPPRNKTISRCIKPDMPKDFPSDRGCCVHAEQRAIMDALRHHPTKIIGSRLYFARLNKENKIEFAGKPYCTICSKMALDVNISEFVLWHKNGICVYDTDEYNSLSFGFRG